MVSEMKLYKHDLTKVVVEMQCTYTEQGTVQETKTHYVKKKKKM